MHKINCEEIYREDKVEKKDKEFNGKRDSEGQIQNSLIMFILWF